MKRILTVFFILSGYLLSGCENASTPPESKSDLTLVETHYIDVSEPSGITLDRSREYLWVVSDTFRRICKLSLTGERLEIISVSTGDLEGITQTDDDRTLFYLSEAERKIVQIDTSGNELDSLFLTSLMHGDPNNGPEGITYKPSTDQFCVINENSPSILLYVNSTGEVDSTVRLSFAIDYSGICMASEDEFWIVSDRSKTLSRVDASGNELFSFDLPDTGIEGVAYDSLSGTIYLVNDPQEMLYIYSYDN